MSHTSSRRAFLGQVLPAAGLLVLGSRSSRGRADYGGPNSRPNLSNTAFMMEALRDSGLPADDPALRRALVFVSRCQNLKGEFNDQPWAGKVSDGGFIYTAADGGSSPAGKTE